MGQLQVKVVLFQTEGEAQTTHFPVEGLKKLDEAQRHLAVAVSKVNPGGQHSHNPEDAT